MIVASSLYFVLMLFISFSGEDMIGIQLLLTGGGGLIGWPLCMWSAIAMGGRTIWLWEAEGLIARPAWAGILFTIGAFLPAFIQHGTSEDFLVLGLSLGWYAACGLGIWLVAYLIFGWEPKQD